MAATVQPAEKRIEKSAQAFRTISEVATELDVPQHVLRFWESKFSQVRPLKRGGGRRYYRPEDIDLLRRIRSLLYEDGYTIKGVQRLLKESRGRLGQREGVAALPEPRLVDVETAQQWDSRGHFFAAAAEAMRRILLNRARDKGRLKRSGKRQRIELDRIEVALDTPSDDLIELDEAIESLALEDELGAKLVKLRFFAGLTLKDAAASLGIARRTADRHWAFARAWLYDQLSRGRVEED